MATCGDGTCDKPARKRGFCCNHYEQRRRSGRFVMRESDPAIRFWSRVDRRGPDECWPWKGAKASGYGRVSWHGKVIPAHHVAYVLLVGPVPEGDLDHDCHNKDPDCAGGGTCPHRACVNIRTHVKPATRRDNLLRGKTLVAAHAAHTHCPQGHKFTPENTYVWRGARHCRTCRAQVSARRDRTRPPRRVVNAECVSCGVLFTFERSPGQAPNVCSEPCRAARKRRTARDFQRSKRQQARATQSR